MPDSVNQNGDTPAVPEGICAPRRVKLPDRRRAFEEYLEGTEAQDRDKLVATSPPSGGEICNEQSNTGNSLPDQAEDSAGLTTGLRANTGVPGSEDQIEALNAETSPTTGAEGAHIETLPQANPGDSSPDTENTKDFFPDSTVDAEGNELGEQADTTEGPTAGLQADTEDPIM